MLSVLGRWLHRPIHAKACVGRYEVGDRAGWPMPRERAPVAANVLLLLHPAKIPVHLCVFDDDVRADRHHWPIQLELARHGDLIVPRVKNDEDTTRRVRHRADTGNDLRVERRRRVIRDVFVKEPLSCGVPTSAAALEALSPRVNGMYLARGVDEAEHACVKEGAPAIEGARLDDEIWPATVAVLYGHAQTAAGGAQVSAGM